MPLCSLNRLRAFLHRKPGSVLLYGVPLVILLCICCNEIYWKHHEWWNDLMAKPMSEYSWPLNIDAAKLMQEYKSGTLSIQPITVDQSSISLFPSSKYCESSLITVLIKTRVEDRRNRDLLRQTWIEDLHKYNLQHSFLLGQCKSKECNNTLKLELSEHEDIIQGDFIDAYLNNTLKFRMGLKYITNHCDKSDYVLIIDGDYSLNVKRLVEYLKEKAYPPDLYAGRVWSDARPFRDPNHPHYMSFEFYPYRRLPPFIAAGATLISATVAKSLNIVGQFTKYLPFDDVFYGMVAKKLNLKLTDLTPLLPSYFMPSLTPAHIHKSLIGSHRYGNLTEIRLIHKYIHS